MQNARLDELQAGIKSARRNISNLRYSGDTTLMKENEEALKNLLMRVKEESEKTGLKFNIQRTKIMASSLITSRQIEGENVEVVTDFLFLGSEITVDGDCSHEIRRQLLLGRKAMTNLDCVEKQRYYSADMVRVFKAMVFPRVMYGCDSEVSTHLILFDVLGTDDYDDFRLILKLLEHVKLAVRLEAWQYTAGMIVVE